jgi:magnesium-dependent phosphatase 1
LAPRKAIEFFDNLQIFPGSKTMHFRKIHRDTRLPYEEMLFFDDESRNKNVESLGVVMQLVRDGVTWPEVENGVRAWRKRNGRGKAEITEDK